MLSALGSRSSREAKRCSNSTLLKLPRAMLLSRILLSNIASGLASFGALVLLFSLAMVFGLSVREFLDCGEGMRTSGGSVNIYAIVAKVRIVIPSFLKTLLQNNHYSFGFSHLEYSQLFPRHYF